MTRSLPRCDLFLPSLTGLSGVPVVKSAPAASSANHVANAGKGKGGGEARRLTMWTGRRAARAALRSEQVCGVVGSRPLNHFPRRCRFRCVGNVESSAGIRQVRGRHACIWRFVPQAGVDDGGHLESLSGAARRSQARTTS